MRYYGPYKQNFCWTQAYSRPSLHGKFATILFDTNKWWHLGLFNSDGFDTKEAAMADLDKILVEKYNAVFLTQEQFDKLKVLV